MSTSEENRSPHPSYARGGSTATLIARGGAGVSIHVFDSNQTLVGAGIAELCLELPEGLYAIEWLSGGLQNEQLVKLRASSAPLEVNYADFVAGAVFVVPGPGPDVVKQVGSESSQARALWRSSIVIVTTASPGLSALDLSNEIALYTNAEKLKRPTESAIPRFALSEQETARCYSVRPGRYHMRFRSVFGELVEQSVPALAGRQTTVFLSGIASSILVPDGQSFATVEGTGVDPALTVIISTAGDEEQYRIRERVRLAGVLLHDLATTNTSLAQGFVDILDDKRTDPLLRLYAALVVLSRLEAGSSPALDDELPGDAGRAASFSEHWARKAAEWTGDPGERGMPPDATAVFWRIGAAYPQVARTIGMRTVPRRIQVPPMFDCSWRWAIARSIFHPNAVSGTAALLAAGRSSTASSPWLCWKPAAATAAPIKVRDNTHSDVETLARDIAQKAEQLAAVDRPQGVSPKLLELLTPQASATAIRASQLAGSTSSTQSTSLSADLATALKMPAHQLKRQLIRTKQELDTVLARTEPVAPFTERNREGADGDVSPRTSSRSASSEPVHLSAPGLLRRIIEPDDPQKGRFGGRATRGGFMASASFKQQSRDWTAIKIVVEGNAKNGTRVQFYLHDSFSPMMEVARFRQGRATLDVSAWGGFTVGIWIPDLEIELELDLARTRGAPSNIRNR